jgi:head-tail adaptor
MSREPHLNRKLVLEAPQQVPDGAGGLTEIWVSLGAVWAEVKAGSGREVEEDFLTLSYVPYRITVRAAPPGALSRPRPEQRLREGGRIYRILAVADADPAGRFLTCFAREEEVSA